MDRLTHSPRDADTDKSQDDIPPSTPRHNATDQGALRPRACFDESTDGQNIQNMRLGLRNRIGSEVEGRCTGQGCPLRLNNDHVEMSEARDLPAGRTAAATVHSGVAIALAFLFGILALAVFVSLNRQPEAGPRVPGGPSQHTSYNSSAGGNAIQLNDSHHNIVNYNEIAALSTIIAVVIIAGKPKIPSTKQDIG